MSSREYRRLGWKLLRIELRRKILTKIRDLHREWQHKLRKEDSHREEQLEFRL